MTFCSWRNSDVHVLFFVKYILKNQGVSHLFIMITFNFFGSSYWQLLRHLHFVHFLLKMNKILRETTDSITWDCAFDHFNNRKLLQCQQDLRVFEKTFSIIFAVAIYVAKTVRDVTHFRESCLAHHITIIIIMIMTTSITFSISHGWTYLCARSIPYTLNHIWKVRKVGKLLSKVSL